MPKIVDHDERRQLIVDGMWRIVQRDGLAAVSVRSIAAEVGLSKSTIGHYFPSQAQVLSLAVEQTIESTTADAIELDLDNCTPAIAESVLLLMVPTTARQRKRAEVWLALLDERNSDPDIGATLTHLNQMVREGIRTLLASMAANGLVGKGRDLDRETIKIHAVIDGLSLQTLTDQKATPTATVKQVLAEVVSDLAVPVVH